MIQVRYGLFETNSSSTMTFAVQICQVAELEIPPVVRIDSNGDHWKSDLNGVYAWAAIKQEEEQFLGLLKHAGVKEIYVDGRPVNADPENRRVTFCREEVLLAKCFGDFQSFSEWHGYNDEWDNSQYLTKGEIKTVQTLIKDPKYLIICIDEDGNEIDWESTRFAKMVISDEEVEAEKEYLAHKKEYDEDIESEYDGYDGYENETIKDLQEEDAAWEDDDFYLTKKNRHNKKKNRKR